MKRQRRDISKDSREAVQRQGVGRRALRKNSREVLTEETPHRHKSFQENRSALRKIERRRGKALANEWAEALLKLGDVEPLDA